MCDWSYKWFLKEYKNQKKAGDGAGEIKYGSTFSSEYDYYVYLSSRYRLQVIDKLKEAGEAQDVYNYYLQNPDEFRESESFVFDYYSVPLTQENADSLLEQAAAGTETPEVTYRKITLDGYTSKYEQGLIVDIDDQMETLRVPGQCSRWRTRQSDLSSGRSVMPKGRSGISRTAGNRRRIGITNRNMIGWWRKKRRRYRRRPPDGMTR